MNPPTDPLQLVVYGVGTLIVVLALKLWDRRRDGKLQRTAAEAAQHASDAAQHASTVADAVGRVEQATGTRASSEQAAEILQTGHDANASLVRIAMLLGEVRADVRRLSGLPERVAQIEAHMDDLVLPAAVRKRRERD